MSCPAVALLDDPYLLKGFDQRYNAGRSFVEMAGIDTLALFRAFASALTIS
jgi:hypothetical protein